MFLIILFPYRYSCSSTSRPSWKSVLNQRVTVINWYSNPNYRAKCKLWIGNGFLEAPAIHQYQKGVISDRSLASVCRTISFTVAGQLWREITLTIIHFCLMRSHNCTGASAAVCIPVQNTGGYSDVIRDPSVVITNRRLLSQTPVRPKTCLYK